jgi:peptidoglycan/LPS O-acetylase OafA/YrhL
LSKPTSNDPAPTGGTSAPERPFRLGYQPGLDGIRGLAVVAIMMFHSFVLWPDIYGKVMPGAYITVNLFFVLSGFLITSLLLTERERRSRVSFTSFYQRRALRLFPALAVLLIVFTAYVFIMHRDSIVDELSAVGWIAIYTSNWAQWSGRFSNLYVSLSLGHTWTLSVEEQFYLLWPVLLVFMLGLRARLRTIGWILVAGVVFVTVERAWLTSRVAIPFGASSASAAGIYERTIGIRTDLRADTLLLGALAAVVLHNGYRSGRAMRVAGSVSLLILILVSLFVQPDARWMYAWGFTIVDVAAAVLCVAVLDTAWRAGSVFRTGPAAWLGRLSYALYLWHLPVFVAFSVDATALSLGARVALAWIVTFALATASYYFVETPFLRLKDRLSERARATAPTRTPTVAADPAAP